MAELSADIMRDLDGQLASSTFPAGLLLVVGDPNGPYAVRFPDGHVEYGHMGEERSFYASQQTI